MSHHIVALNNASYVYPDGTQALNSVTCTIHHGEAVAIIGANGAGKSTLLSCLAGIHYPSGGTIRIGDYPVTKQTLPHIRKSVGMVFQNPDDQLFMPTVFDDVAFGPLNLGLPAEEIEQRVMAALEAVGAAQLSRRPAYKLSGGQKRAVAIATVLSMQPDILVMDEPTAALDAAARRQVMSLLQSFWHTRIIATHDMDLAAAICTRTIVLGDGRIVADGRTNDIFRDAALLASYGLERPLGMQACPVCGQEPS